MPWNEPGGKGNNNDPWSGKNNQNPPDLDKFLSDLLKKIRAIFNGKNTKNISWQPSEQHNMGLLLGVVAVVMVIAWFLSGLFIVNPAEEAVILRLGKYSAVEQPGLHWLARFIDKKYLLDVQKIYSFSLEGDFITKSSDQNDLPNQYIQVETPQKTATGSDQSKNLVNVELNVQYRISNPRAYLFNVVNPDHTIKAVASGALSDTVGQMKLDEVLTTGRETLSTGVLERIKKILIPYNTGLEVITVNLRKVQAPDQVRAAFSDVNRADQDKATYIQQAQAYASKVVPLAQGVAARILADATGYQQQAVLKAQANIAKYEAILKVYITAPDITRQRMYFETMQTVLQNTTKVLVDVNSNNLIYLPIDKLIKQDNQTTLDKSTITSAQTFPTTSYGHSDLNNSGQAMSGEVKNETN